MIDGKVTDGVVLVLGASGGVGRVLVRQLAERGYRVLGSVLNEAELAAAQADGLPGASYCVADLSRVENGMGQIRDALAQHGQPLLAAINCAAINPLGPLETTPIDVARTVFEINTLASLALYQLVLPMLRESGGRLIFVSSMAGKIAMPLLGYYTVSKFALEGLADTMRLEAGQWGVPVVLIQPGAIATDMVHGFAAVLDARFAQLDAAGRENYGDYFAQHKAFTQGADDFLLSPAAVGLAIIEALEADVPQTRYALGNAVELLEMRRTGSDEVVDATINAMLPGSRSRG